MSFSPALFVAKETLFIYGSIFVLFQKESSIWLLVHLKKTALFRTQLSTYSRCFITSVEHENSGEHEISGLSLSTVDNLGPRCPGTPFQPLSWSDFLFIKSELIMKTPRGDATPALVPQVMTFLTYKRGTLPQILITVTRRC